MNKLDFKKEINDEAPDEDYYVLYHEGNKIGYILIDKNYLDALYVYPEYRGKGYGNILIDKAIDLGVTYLSVDPKNIPAINLYKKFGFKIDKFHNENGYDEYIMRLDRVKPESFDYKGLHITHDNESEEKIKNHIDELIENYYGYFKDAKNITFTSNNERYERILIDEKLYDYRDNRLFFIREKSKA